MKNKELDNILDQVTAGIHSEQVDGKLVNEASARVWTNLETEAMSAQSPQGASASSVERIEGCPDFQALIPAYLGGKLSEARSLLLVDHTHECIPCRRALKQAREGRVETAAPVRRKQQRRAGTYSLRPVILRWGIAAALVIGLGLIALPLIQRYTGSIEATVQAADLSLPDRKLTDLASLTWHDLCDGLEAGPSPGGGDCNPDPPDVGAGSQSVISQLPTTTDRRAPCASRCRRSFSPTVMTRSHRRIRKDSRRARPRCTAPGTLPSSMSGKLSRAS